MAVFRPMNARTERMGEVRTPGLEQFDHGGDIFLFGPDEVIPPGFEPIGYLNRSFHIRNIANKECIVNCEIMLSVSGAR